MLLLFGFFAAQAQTNYKISQNRLILPEPIIFQEHANDVFDTTDAMIDYVAQYMLNNPGITKLRVESHVFTEKDENENTKLSLQRAAIITYYLTLKGVDCSRLTASGFGNTNPVDSLTDKYTNTRIEFFIQEAKNRNIPYTNDFSPKLYNPCED
jgi:outer membrane protein OmpA-like peptidoglycan-associated protein